MSPKQEEKFDQMIAKLDRIEISISGDNLGNDGMAKRQKIVENEVSELKRDIGSIKTKVALVSATISAIGTYIWHLISTGDRS